MVYAQKIKTYNLFLDDERHPKEDYYTYLSKISDGFSVIYLLKGWEIVRTFEEFVNIITEQVLPDNISFDHDLGEEKTGYDCCWWLIDYCIDNDIKLTSECRFHTANPIGKENMKNLINNMKKFQSKNK